MGITFQSLSYNTFEEHYTVNAAKARAVSPATFTLQSFIGDLRPLKGLHMYMARVDPHLTFGCEVSLNT